MVMTCDVCLLNAVISRCIGSYIHVYSIRYLYISFSSYRMSILIFNIAILYQLVPSVIQNSSVVICFERILKNFFL